MALQSRVSFDGSWSQRCEALHCFRAFIDPYQKKGGDFEVVEQSQKNFRGNDIGTAQAMQGEILRRQPLGNMTNGFADRELLTSNEQLAI
jgi:hypothetical protein